MERKNAFGWGRLVLINSVLSNLSMFMLSFFEVSRGVLEKLDYYISRFFGTTMGIRKGIDRQNGVYCIHLRTKVG
jgi:intein-encoded DNA endonuclease-like protein